MKKTIFNGAGVAIITPMHADGSVNFEKLGDLIDFQVKNKTDAIVICGTTGESATLSDEEHLKVIQYAVEKTAHRIPVVAGTGSNDTAYAAKLSLQAEKAGVDALLCVTPYYNKATQNGLIQHFTKIADCVHIPIILYNVPSRTGVTIQPETFKVLSKHPNIVAAKEASGDVTAAARTAALCGDDLALYSGNDDQTLALLSLGAKGVISVLSNIMPQQTHDLCARFFEGDLVAARKLQLSLLPLMDALFVEVNPAPVKEALNLMGFDVGPGRLPMVPLAAEHHDLLKERLKAFGLLN